MRKNLSFWRVCSREWYLALHYVMCICQVKYCITDLNIRHLKYNEHLFLRNWQTFVPSNLMRERALSLWHNGSLTPPVSNAKSSRTRGLEAITTDFLPSRNVTFAVVHRQVSALSVFFKIVLWAYINIEAHEWFTTNISRPVGIITFVGYAK